jgi:hypothetical protein
MDSMCREKHSLGKWQIKGRPLVISFFATAVMLAFMCQWSSAECRLPFPNIGIPKSDEKQVTENNAMKTQVHLFIAGEYAKEFGESFLAAVIDDLGADGQGPYSLFKNVTVDIVENLSAYMAKTKTNPGIHEVAIILDSEFMNGAIPKYNKFLNMYKNSKFGPSEIMFIDPYRPMWKDPVIVQINEKVGAQNAIYLIEISLSLVIGSDLMSNTEFRDYAFQATSEIGPGQQVSKEFLQTRKRLMLDCIIGSSGAN